MHTMSLYDSKDSTGKASIQDMYNGTLNNALNEKITLERVGKSAKRHFIDPSLACACLDLTKDKLIKETYVYI